MTIAPLLCSDPRRNAVLLGPGNGVTEATRDNVLATLSLEKACVLDADALTVFADKPADLFAALRARCVLTPHDGEYARLLDATGDRLTRARALAAASGAVVLLKGPTTVVAEPGRHAVVDNDAGLVAHERVAASAELQITESSGVHACEKFRGIGAADVDLTERPDIDDAGAAAHRLHFADNRLVTHERTVIFGSQPGAGVHEHRPGRLMPAVDRRAPVRMESTARKFTDRRRLRERAKSRIADSTHRLAGRLGQYPAGIEVRNLALRRAHADSGVTLDELGAVVTFLDGVDDVLDLHVLVEIDKCLALRMLDDRVRI